MSTNYKIPDNLIAFRTGTGFFVTPVEDIVFCEADGNYSKLTIVGEKETMVTQNLKAVLQNLPEALFLRVHNSFAVNVLHIRKVVNNGCLTLCLSDGKRVQVAHRRRQEVLGLFEKMLDGHT